MMRRHCAIRWFCVHPTGIHESRSTAGRIGLGIEQQIEVVSTQLLHIGGREWLAAKSQEVAPHKRRQRLTLLSMEPRYDGLLHSAIIE